MNTERPNNSEVNFSGKDIELQNKLLQDIPEENILRVIEEDAASLRDYFEEHPEIIESEYKKDPDGTVERLKEMGFYHHNNNEENGKNIH